MCQISRIDSSVSRPPPPLDSVSSRSEPAKTTTKSGFLGFLRMTGNVLGTFFKAIWRSVFSQPDPKMKLLVTGDVGGKPLSDIPDRQFKAIGVLPSSLDRMAEVKTVTRNEAIAIQTDACLTGLNSEKAKEKGWNKLSKYAGKYCDSREEDEKNRNQLANSAKILISHADEKFKGPWLNYFQKAMYDRLDGRLPPSMEQLKISGKSLPAEVSSKSLKAEAINNCLGALLLPEDIKDGTINDAESGLRAQISINPATREIVVGFPGAQNSSDCKKCFDAMAGYIPTNFAKADEIVGKLKEHLQWANSHLNDDAKFSLRVVGHSMGGGIAAYVGSKHEIPFTTFNGLKLGSGLLKAIGEEKVAAAAQFGKRYVNEGDWVGDKRGGKGFTAWAFKGLDSGRYLGAGYLIPKEYDREVQLGHEDQDTHNHPVEILDDLSKNRQYEESVPPPVHLPEMDFIMTRV